MPRYRQLPDGTWLDEQFNRVTAPVVDPLGTGTYKREPSPSAGPMGVQFRQPHIATHAQSIDGMGIYSPGWTGLHAAHGRNYPALGFLDNMSPTMKNLALAGMAIAGAGLTVWLIRKGAGKK